MNERGQERLAKWTARLVDAEADEAATKAVIEEIGAEAWRLRREGDAMAHLYSGLTDLTKAKSDA